jgi:LysR family transcriptional regulator, transcriptional activator of nhaA
MAPIRNTDTYRTLSQLNLNHLLYFWAVARTGSVTAASERLGVSQPSVSEQIRTLERRLQARLFDRNARGMTLTPEGQVAMRFAEELVGVCSDLVRSIPIEREESVRPLSIGAADAVPKIIVQNILAPAWAESPAIPVVCREWRVDHLLAELSLHRLDAVITDAAVDLDNEAAIRTYAAGSAAVDLYASPALARRVRRLFPARADEIPMLFTTEGSSLRTELDRWFAVRRMTPRVAAEADDRALLHHLAGQSVGAVPVPVSIGKQIAAQFGLTRLGRLEGLTERYCLSTVNRAHPHPGVERLLEALARHTRRR